MNQEAILPMKHQQCSTFCKHIIASWSNGGGEIIIFPCFQVTGFHYVKKKLRCKSYNNPVLLNKQQRLSNRWTEKHLKQDVYNTWFWNSTLEEALSFIKLVLCSGNINYFVVKNFSLKQWCDEAFPKVLITSTTFYNLYRITVTFSKVLLPLKLNRTIW